MATPYFKFLILHIVLLAFSVTTLAAPAESCPGAVDRISVLIDSKGEWLDKNRPGSGRAKKIRSLQTLKSQVEDIWDDSTNANDQFALVAKVLDFLGYDDQVIIGDPQKAAEFIAKGKIKDKELTGERVIELLTKIHQFKVGQWKDEKPLLEKTLSSKEIQDRQRVEEAILKIKAAPDLILALKKLGIIENPATGPPKKWNRIFLNKWIQYAMTFAFNAMSLRMTPHLVSFYPKAPPSSFAKVPDRVMEFILKNGWDKGDYSWEKGYAQVEADLKQWGRVDQIWAVGRKAFVTYLSVLVLYMSIIYAPWLKTAYTAWHMTEASTAQYDQDHYDSKTIIQEQYDNWVDSCDTPPSDAEKAQQLALITQWEREGVFRHHPPPAQAQPPTQK